MCKPFKYDVLTLIDLVESKPCLWDKTLDCFKDKIEKQKAWKEVCAFLEEDFLGMDGQEQHKLGLQINAKWQNVRDSFVKSLKKTSGQGTSKKYIYHDYLIFLTKIVKKDDTESSIELQLQECGEHQEIEENIDEVFSAAAKVSQECNRKKRVRIEDDIDREILKSLRERKADPDEDEAFFLSILPSVRRMSETDKLDFRMRVMQMIKDVNIRNDNM